MGQIARIPVVWSGSTGLPGVSVHYSTVANVVAAVAALNAFFTGVAASFPSVISWQTPSSGDVLEETTGELVSGWTGGAGTTIAASGGAANFAAGVGARVQWTTSNIVAGRRPRGSTFMVPLVVGAYDGTGTLAAGTVTGMMAAANTLVGTGTLLIWSRPSPGGSDGASSVISGRNVPDKVATLRSRRV